MIATEGTQRTATERNSSIKRDITRINADSLGTETTPERNSAFATNADFGYCYLYRVNLEDATTSLIGNTATGYLEALAVSPDGQLFGADSVGDLYLVDHESGAATFIGHTGLGDIEGLHFYGTALLGIANTDRPATIVSIDTATAATREVVKAKNNTGRVHAMAVLDRRTVLISADGPSAVSGHDLFSVDLKTGDVAFIGALNIGPSYVWLGAMDFDPHGTLYGLDSSHAEWIIDPLTAGVTFVGDVGGNDEWLDMTVRPFRPRNLHKFRSKIPKTE